ncbi:hypothetical protein [Phage DSL-LC04]|jgi:hypothetical protein|nr:hypothetical protein [Phage DSL-LC04]
MDTLAFVWNGLLTLAAAFFALVAYMAQEKFRKLDQVEQQLNQTRVEVARDHVTKEEVQRITEHIDARFNRLEEKIDRLISKG